MDQAITDVTKAIELDPKASDVYMIRGIVYAEKGVKASAIADWEMYLQLVPNASNRA